MIYTFKDFLESLWWSIFAKASKHSYVVFLVCFAIVQVMLSLSLLFIEFLGSCSRWRVTNGVVPCVRMLLCSWEYFKMLLCSSWSSSGFMWMNGQICFWVLPYEYLMNFWVVLWRLFLDVLQNVPGLDLLWNLSWN